VKSPCLRLGWLAVLLLVGVARPGQAQSTIFNIPTTDTVSPKKAYGEFDFLAQAPGPDEGSTIYLYNPRLVVGVANTVEAGVNFPTFHTTGSTAAYIEPNVKAKVFNNDAGGWAAAAGAIYHIRMNNRDDPANPTDWGLVYGEVSKKVKSGKLGPRFHGGPYGVLVSDEKFAGPRGGVLLGYEQPVHPKVSIVADWFSGKNYYGYFTPGASITLPKNGLLNVGYSIGNDSWDNSNATKNRYFFIYYGITFP
jgi:hypothetical protein